MDNEIKLPSGTVLVITPVPFWQAVELNDAVMECFKDKGGMAGLQDVDLMDAFMAVGTSQRVRDHLKGAFLRCTYGGLKLDEEVFRAPNLQDAIRKDFYTLCGRVILENCRPFFEATFSELGTLFGSVRPPSK